MFTSNKVSKSLLDAVSNIVEDKDDNCVTKPEAKSIAKKEVGKHEKGMHGSKGEVAKHEKKMHGEEVEHVEEGLGDKLKAAGKKALEKLGHGSDEAMRKDLQKKMGLPQTGEKPKKEWKEESEFTFKDRLLEREMSKSETKKKEDIVMGMKKNTDYLKKKYGTRWKEVMYATATKRAMGEELEQVEEQEDVSTDMLSGRVQGVGQSNSFKNFKVKIEGSQKTAREPAAHEPPSTKAKESVAAHGGAVPQPRIGVEGHGEVNFNKEEAQVEEGWDDMLKAAKERRGPQPSGGSGVKSGSRYGGSKQKEKPEHDDEKLKKEETITEGKDPSIDVGVGAAPNFVTPENTTSSPVMKRVKEITKTAMGRVKNEMLGKAPGNQ